VTGGPGPDTVDRLETLPAIPSPKENFRPGIGVQLGLLGDSMDGEMGWPGR